MDSYTSELKTVELWLTKDDLAEEVGTLEKIAKAYPYKVKMVTISDIETAIKEGNQNAVFVHKIVPKIQIKRSYLLYYPDQLCDWKTLLFRLSQGKRSFNGWYYAIRF